MSLATLKSAKRGLLLSLLLLGLLLGLLAACAERYPLGMNEREWNNLNPEQQLAARQQQYQIDAETAQRRAEEQARQEQAAAEEQQRIDDLYRYGRRGDIVDCDISAGEDGVVDFRPGWQAFDPITITLARGEAQSFRVESAVGSKTTSIWARFDLSGGYLLICEGNNHNCREVAPSRRDFRRGYEDDNFEIPGKLKRAELYCSY